MPPAVGMETRLSYASASAYSAPAEVSCAPLEPVRSSSTSGWMPPSSAMTAWLRWLAASDQRAPVLRGDHHHVGIELVGRSAESAGDVSSPVHRLQVHAELAGPLFGFFQQAVAWAVAAAGWSQVVVADVNTMEHAAGNALGELARQLEGVIADAGSVNADHQAIDVAHIEVIAHQQHRPR